MSTSLENEGLEDSRQSSELSLSFEEPLQDGALRHMKETGFLGQIKGEIANYLYTIMKEGGHSCVIPERADGKVLSEVYAYLHWLGLRSTAATLLSESPVEIDVEKKEGDPRLSTLFKDVVEEVKVELQEGKVVESRHSESQTDLRGGEFDKEELPRGVEDAGSQTSILQELKSQGNQTEKEDKEGVNVNTGSQTELKLEDASNQTEELVKKNELDQNLNRSNNNDKKYLRVAKSEGLDLLTGSPLSKGEWRGGKVLLTPRPTSASLPLMENEKSFDFDFPTPRGNDSQVFASTSTPLVGDLTARLNSMSLSSTLVETPAPKDSTFTVAGDEGILKTFLARNLPPVSESREEHSGDNRKDEAVIKENEESLKSKEEEGMEGNESEAVVNENEESMKSKKEEVVGMKMEGKESEPEPDTSTSEAISFSLDEDNDNTLDISVSSLAKGTSDCDFVVPVKGSWKSEGN